MEDLPRGTFLSSKTLAIAVRWSVWLLFAAWLLFAGAWGALHLFIVPRIAELRPQLEQQASQALGVSVRIGAINTRSVGFFPTVEFTDVRLFDAKGREALQLPSVLAALSPAALLNRGFEQLYIDRPQLDIRRTAEGRIFVAGIELPKDQGSDGSVGDWLFSQTEIAVHDGNLHWTDETRSTPTLALQHVDLVIRNVARQHDLRLDATPPAELGDRFSLRGEFRQPLLVTQAGRWHEWSGQIFSEFDRVDLAQLKRYVNMGVTVANGSGALRAWTDVKRGQVVGSTADVALSQVSVTLAPQLEPLAMTSLTGRLGGRLLMGGVEFTTQDLQFDTQDGLHWPGGNASVTLVEGDNEANAWGELKGDRLDMNALAQIARRLPVSEKVRDVLTLYAPKGLVERIQARWEGRPQAPLSFEAKGRVVQLDVSSRPAQSPSVDAIAGASPRSDVPPIGSPGVRGAMLDFEVTQAGGRATVQMQNGQLDFPGLFEEPVIMLDQLAADVQWQSHGEDLSVQVSRLSFSNADGQGEAQLKWRTSDPASSSGHARMPGVLDLQGSFSRANLARVHRYLPQVISNPVRSYLRDAITGGRATGVRFRVRGDLQDMPFSDPAKGEFRIAGNLRDASYAYVPPNLQPAGSLPWPALTQLDGELVLDGSSLLLRDVNARLAHAPGLRISRAEARIPDLLREPAVGVRLEARGPLDEVLKGVMRGTPLAAMTGQVLSQSNASGNAEVQLKLQLPLAQLEKSTAQGQVQLTGNDLQLSPALPRLSNAHGVVYFSEQGFAISGGTAQALGGEVRAEGGTIPEPGTGAASAPTLRVQGTMTAEGLRQTRELGVLARVAQKISGKTSYALVMAMRRGTPEFLFTSSLQGLALNLPAPFEKKAADKLPLRLETQLTPETLQAGMDPASRREDQVLLSLGPLVNVKYVRDVSGSEAQVLRGTLALGQPAVAVAMPASGVVAQVNLDTLDLDAWRALAAAPANPAAVPAADQAPAGLGSYLPTVVVLQATELTGGGHKFNRVVAGGMRSGDIWQANLEAREFSGYLEYRPPASAGAGRLYARLARLSLASSAASDVETFLDEQPVSIPALDVVVDDTELLGKKLGRVEIEAVNRGAVNRDGGTREWRLNKFNIILPEAVFTASGNWAVLNETAPAVGRSQSPRPRVRAERRRTVMNFKLEMTDAGALLGRLGMKDVIRRGKGRMEGQVSWVGSPLALDYPTLGGAFNLNVEEGQFLKADPGLAKLLSVLSLQSLPRRLSLDFRDVFSEGFAFDFVRGDAKIEKGIAMSNNLQMKGVNAAVLMDGRADIAGETQDIKVVVVPEINAGTASLIATWINPAVGLGTFLTQLILRRPLIESATQEFQITGSWAEPQITRIDKAAQSANGTTP